MKLAFIGDIHGRHLLVSKTLKELKVDLAFQVGDFKAICREEDLKFFPSPEKYKNIGEFPLFFNGKESYPCPVYFIHGNHENVNLLFPIFQNGGEIISNVHYLGRSGIKDIKGLKIAYLSGVYAKSVWESRRNEYEKNLPNLPNERILKNLLYFYPKEIEKIYNDRLTFSEDIDLLLLHDWPYPFDLRCANLPAGKIMEYLHPKYVICGHYHQFKEEEILWQNGKISKLYALEEVEENKKWIKIMDI